MKTRQLKLLIATSAATVVVVALGAAIVAVTRPIEVDEGPVARANVATTQPAGLPALDALQAVAAKPLRHSLDDTPLAGPSSAPVVAESDAVPVTLVGTIGTSLALLRTQAGEVQLKAIGEDALGAKVLAIRPAQVDIEYNGKSLTLEKPPEPQLPG